MKSLINICFSLHSSFHFISFFFYVLFCFFIFTVINFTNFIFWIIKILVLTPKQSKRISFPPEFFSDCCPLLNQRGAKWFSRSRKGQGLPVPHQSKIFSFSSYLERFPPPVYSRTLIFILSPPKVPPSPTPNTHTHTHTHTN